MFKLRIPSLGRGAIHTSLIAVAAAAIGAFLSATVTHNVTIPKASASHEIAPIDPTCTSSLPCIEYDNNSTGPGIRGISVDGNGLAGSTKNHSTSTANGRAGLIGNDVGTGTFNSGVYGLSVNGTGVSGLSTAGAGVNGASTSYVGVYGKSTGYTGVFGTAPTYGVAGNSGSGVGVYGTSTIGNANGIGVKGYSHNFVGVSAVGGHFDSISGDDFPALSIVANTAGGAFNDLIDGCSPSTANPCDSSNSVFQVHDEGSLIAKGAIFSFSYFDIAGTGSYQKNGSCVAGCTVATTAAAGRAVVKYAPMVSQPTIEDFGESHLVNGQASVRLDPKFANVVDQRANYLVFITPEGDANTLYVTEKSRGGFIVRESHGGRSTLMFSYRIVARPFGSRETRLPMVELPKLRVSSPNRQT